MSQRTKLKFKVGCDPEFTLALNGKCIRADLASTLCKYTFRDSEHGEIGMDVGMAELRPKPSNDIIEVAKNIKFILKKASEKVGFMQWDVTSNIAAVGGHIHIEMPDSYTKGSDSNYEIRNSKVYDYVRKLYSFYMPIWLCDNFKKTNKCRASSGGPGSGGYGHYCDYRIDPHGGAYTFELRTPSAQWLTCPKTMIATFAYVATLHNEIIYHPETFKEFSDIVVKNQDEFKIIEEAARQEYNAFIEPLMKKLKRAVKKMELYPNFKREINWLFNTEKVREEKEKLNYDVLKGWDIEPKEISLAQLNNKRSLEARVKKFDNGTFENYWSQLVPFRFNDDANVAVWSHELAKRMYMLNWKVQRQYIFYGFKKGTISEAVVADRDFNIYLGNKALNTEEKVGQAKHAIKKMIGKYSPKENEYIVGLPYDVRKQDDMKFLTELVHFMEKELPVNPKQQTAEEKTKLMTLKDAKEIIPEPKKKSPPSTNSRFNIGDVVNCISSYANEYFSGNATVARIEDDRLALILEDSEPDDDDWYFPECDYRYLRVVQHAPVRT